MEEVKKFALQLSMVAVIGLALVYLLQSVEPANWHTPHAWVLVAFFYLMGIGFYGGLIYSTDGDPKAFIRFYLAGTTIKLFVLLAVLVLFSLALPQSARGFIIKFFILYLIFTAFEVHYLYKKYKSN